MLPKPILPILDRANELFDYDPETGVFTYKIAPSPSHEFLVGKPAGGPNKGYTVLTIDKVRYYAHRVAWALLHGEEPPVEIDHIDRDRMNNSADNLRRGDNGGNRMNIPSRSVSGVVGVFFDKSRGRYLASMGRKKNHRRLYWGRDFFEAVCARKSAENRFWAAA